MIERGNAGVDNGKKSGAWVNNEKKKCLANEKEENKFQSWWWSKIIGQCRDRSGAWVASCIIYIASTLIIMGISTEKEDIS